jgi:hypothetical protein
MVTDSGEARLRQADAREGTGAIEFGLKKRQLRVEHVALRKHAGAIAFGDDATGFGGGAH